MRSTTDRAVPATAGIGLVAWLCCLGAAFSAGAAIPEPDHLFYGTVSADAPGLCGDASVVLRTGEGDSIILASSSPGELPNAPDFFVLSVRVEQPATPDEPQTPGVARVGDAATVYVNDVPVQELVVGGRGLAVRVDLQVAGAACDPRDSDGDGVPDVADNCGAIANGNQADTDGNGVGDACEAIVNPSGGRGFASIADVGNAPDPATGLGSVSYVFEIQATEVTNVEYVAFLNAVAADDPVGLYSEEMASDPRGGILRSGVPGLYGYQVKPNFGDKPVNFVSWLDAARYANWLENGMPTGAQDASTTETGAFDLTGAEPGVTAEMDPSAIWSLPSEDEWYKAAYFDPFADPALPRYRLYPTGADTDPALARSDALGNVANPEDLPANHESGASWSGLAGHVVAVGSAETPSPYGTADQAGNVAEWLGAAAEEDARIVRGGGFASDRIELRADFGSAAPSERELQRRAPEDEAADVGFRVVRLADLDGDGVVDELDNCVLVPNTDQADADLDAIGDACECGDANKDGRVTTVDARLVQRCAVFDLVDPEVCEGLCDTNGDGRCTTVDARLIQRLAVGQIAKEALVCAERPAF